MRPLLLSLVLLVPGSLLAQTNLPEGETVLEGASPCPGPAQAIGLAPVGDIDLPAGSAHLKIGPTLRICFTGTEVTLFADEAVTYPCTEIRDSPDEGIGHYFTAEDIPYHLWLHIDPEARDPSLEIGIYREDDELAWIDTGTAICAR